jgi:hypothetical protein
LDVSFPDQVNEFRLYNDVRTVQEFTNFKTSLLALSDKVKYTFGVWDFKISLTDLTEILEKFHKIPHLDLYRNQFIDFEEEMKLDINIKYEINGLDLRWSSGLDFKKVEILVKGMAKNKSLLKSLQYIWVAGTRLDVNQLQQLFTNNLFNVII